MTQAMRGDRPWYVVAKTLSWTGTSIVVPVVVCTRTAATPSGTKAERRSLVVEEATVETEPTTVAVPSTAGLAPPHPEPPKPEMQSPWLPIATVSPEPSLAVARRAKRPGSALVRG